MRVGHSRSYPLFLWRIHPITTRFLTLRNALLVLPLALLVGCSATAPSPSQTSDEPVGVQRTPATQREPAPDLTGPTLDGGELSLSDLRGKTVVLNTWASWCGPCKEELPVLAAASQSYPKVQFVGLNVEDSPERAVAMQEKYGIEYPSIVDENGQLFAQLPWLPRALPGTLVIDPEGRVRATIIGQVTEKDLDSVLR